jgi:iron complex outermembrane recepter protein
MKKILIMLFIFLFGAVAFSQNSLNGTVTDKSTGNSLPNATLYFTDLMKGGSADLDGHYTLEGLPNGLFMLEVNYLGYRSFVGKVLISGNTHYDFALTPAAAEMREVIITGSSSSIERRLNPFPSIILNNDDLRVNSSTNIVDALAHHPGISQVTTGSGISKPVIRGLGYNRVVELVDGIRQEDQQWGDEHGVEVDEYSISRVEVIKGPGSIMYGSDAMAGVVNFLYPAPPEEGKISMDISSEYQTNNHLAGISVNNSGNLNGVNWLLRGSAKIAGNFKNSSDGRVFNSGFNEMNSNGYLGLNRRWGYSQLQFSVFNEHLGLVEGDRDSLGRFLKPNVFSDSLVSEAPATNSDLDGYVISVPWQKLLHWKVVSASSILMGKSRIGLKIAFQQNRRTEIADPIFPNDASLFLNLNTLTYDLKYFFPESRNWETSAGIGGMIQQNRDGGVEYLIPEYDLKDAGIFVFTRKEIGKFNLSGGSRVDLRKISSFGLVLKDEGQKFSAFSRSFSNFSGSIGGSYQFNVSLVVKLNIARGFRAPNIAELASNGKHEGTYRFELGNQGLNPETSFQVDAGIDVDRTHISFEADIFYNSIRNFIFPEKLNSLSGGDSIVSQLDPVPAFRFIQGQASIYGGELTLDLHPHPYDWIHFENSVSYVRGIHAGNDDSIANLPMMPPLKISSQLRVNIEKTPHWIKNLYVSVGAEITMKQEKVYSAFGTETPTPSYALMDAGLGWEIVGKENKKILSFIINGSNILNVDYQDHLSRLKYSPVNPLTGKQGIFNMGRNIGFKIQVPVCWHIRR